MKRSLVLALFLVLACLLPATARGDASGRDAGKHFARGVDLYGDGDFRGALVEFKRAHALLPRATVLYDIGETEYQLQDYARALTTLKRFLAETGPNAAHRTEVEATVEILRGRVGKIVLGTDASGCEVSIDEQPAGNTPLAQPVTVSVGPRKVAVTCAGAPATVRIVEVAAGETSRLDLHLAPAPATVALAAAVAPPPPPSKESLRRKSRLRLALTWTTSTLLLAGAIGLGTTALVESARLDGMKQQFPVQADALSKQASVTRALAISADVVGAAALVAVAVSSYITVRERQHTKLRLAVSPGSVALLGSF